MVGSFEPGDRVLVGGSPRPTICVSRLVLEFWTVPGDSSRANRSQVVSDLPGRNASDEVSWR